MSAVCVYGVPFELGGPGRGTSAAPDFLVAGGLIDQLRTLDVAIHYDNLRVGLDPEVFTGMHYPSRDFLKVRHVRELLTLLPRLAQRVQTALELDSRALVIGGDHAIAAGSILGALNAVGRKKKLGLVWIDAHLDAHSVTTTHTGNTHGMPLAAVIGEGGEMFRSLFKRNTIDPHDVLHIGEGSNDCEEEEDILLRQLGVTRFSECVLRTHGWESVFRVINGVARQVDHLWVSFDLDVVCEKDAPGVHYRRKDGGLTRSEVLSLAKVLHSTKKVIGADIVELNPFKDKDSVTAQLVIDFACNLF